MKKTWSVTNLIVIILLAASSFVSAKGILEMRSMRLVESWLSDKPKMYTAQLTDSQKDEFVAVLREFSEERGFTAVSRNRESLQSGSALYTFSVLVPDSAEGADFEPLDLLGTRVVDGSVAREISAANPGSYVGYGNDAFSRVETLPSIRAGLYFRVDRLESGSSLGRTCTVIGLDDGEFQTLVNDLSSAIGVSADSLTTEMSGSATDMGLIYWFCEGAFVVLAIVLCLLTVTHSLLELRTLGVHLMLGWSRRAFAAELIANQAAFLPVVIPIGLLGSLAIFDGLPLGPAPIAFAALSVLPAVMVVLVSWGVSIVPLATVHPVDAICGRYSRRGFYALAVSVYLLCTVAIFGACLYIDQPLDMYAALVHTRTVWSEYKDWYVVRDFSLDGSHFTGDPMSLSKDMYAWYASHESDEDVYLVNTTYFDATAITAYMRGSSDDMPEPFWYLAASPSYLEQVGIDVPSDVIERAEHGERVYLLPETLDASEAEAVKSLLVSARKVSDSNIVTAFMENPQYEFITYDSNRELFTWSAGADQPTTASGFVIGVITAENMVPFESESLVASGLDSGYVKLGNSAASRLLGDDGAASLGKSLAVRFATVENYISGLQKSLMDLFALFGMVLFLLMATASVVVACIVGIVNQVSAREISVKYVLGFGVWELYRREVLFVNASTMAGIVISAILRCNAGLLVGAALLCISNLAILIMSRTRTASVVLETVSREQ